MELGGPGQGTVLIRGSQQVKYIYFFCQCLLLWVECRKCQSMFRYINPDALLNFLPSTYITLYPLSTKLVGNSDSVIIGLPAHQWCAKALEPYTPTRVKIRLNLWWLVIFPQLLLGHWSPNWPHDPFKSGGSTVPISTRGTWKLASLESHLVHTGCRQPSSLQPYHLPWGQLLTALLTSPCKNLCLLSLVHSPLLSPRPSILSWPPPGHLEAPLQWVWLLPKTERAANLMQLLQKSLGQENAKMSLAICLIWKEGNYLNVSINYLDSLLSRIVMQL